MGVVVKADVQLCLLLLIRLSISECELNNMYEKM